MLPPAVTPPTLSTPPKRGGQPKPSRAGRNLPAATAVGLGLLVSIGLCMFYVRPAFVLVVCAAVCLALGELRRALSQQGYRLATVPAQVGGIGMVISAYYLGLEALFAATMMALGVCVLWLLLGERTGKLLVSDIANSAFALAYIPLLASFALLLYHDFGPAITALYIIAVVASDTGGYALGVLIGKHPIMPSVSPKKSWEGFVGSVLLCAAAAFGGAWILSLPWIVAIVLTVLTPFIATLGDFCESLLKRDLGVKDMGSLLPGHGGVLDRLDSLLVFAPFAFIIFKCLLRG